MGGPSRLLATTAVALAGTLAGCGGGSTGPTPYLANLDGTLDTCTIADGGNSCAATVKWTSAGASSVTLSIDGTVVSTAASGTASPTVTYGTPISVVLVAGDTTVGPRSIRAGCASTSSWNGTACVPAGGSFALTSFAVADGDTGVSSTLPLTGVATRTLTSGTATIACHDADDDTVTLPVSVAVVVAGPQFTVQPTYVTYAMLPHHASCTLTATVFDGSLDSVTTGPRAFTTDTGPVLHSVLARAGASGLPFVVDAATGAASSPAAMSANLADCWGAFDRHLARVRTLCGRSAAGLGAVWDIDPGTNVATPVTSLTSVFSNGNISEPDVVIDHLGTSYMTRGGLQSDGSTNSMIVVVTFTGHSLVSWDWGGRADYIARLLLDDSGGTLYAVSHLGLIETISTSTLAVTGHFDAGATVNDALLSGGKLVLAVKPAAVGDPNLLVFDPVAGTLVTGVPAVGTGRATQALALSAGDLLVSSSDLLHSVLTGTVCRLDPATFAPRTPSCTTVGAVAPLALASDDVTVFGDLADVLVTWPVADFTTATPLATFDGPVSRLAVVQN